MSKRSRHSGNRCFLCGAQCVPCKDNFGQPYMGCPRCVVVGPTTKETLVDPARRLVREESE